MYQLRLATVLLAHDYHHWAIPYNHPHPSISKKLSSQQRSVQIETTIHSKINIHTQTSIPHTGEVLALILAHHVLPQITQQEFIPAMNIINATTADSPVPRVGPIESRVTFKDIELEEIPLHYHQLHTNTWHVLTMYTCTCGQITLVSSYKTR